MRRTAKLFRNGRSQAVRLPSEYQFEGSEVYIRRDPSTRNVVLSRRPESWEEFFELLKTIDVPHDFLSHRDDARAQKRHLFLPIGDLLDPSLRRIHSRALSSRW